MARNGVKTGGRKKGTPNKRTESFVDVLGDYNPLETLVKIAEDKNTPLDTKIKINLDLLPYIYPKRKAIEMIDTSEKYPITLVRFSNDYQDDSDKVSI